MSRKNYRYSGQAVVIGVVLIFIGVALQNIFGPLIGFLWGGASLVIGVLVFILGIILFFTTYRSKDVESEDTISKVKKEETLAGPEEFVPEVLLPQPGKKQLPVSTVEGIGKKYSGELEKGGIQYVEDLALSRPETVTKLTGVHTITAQKWIAMARLTWLDDVSNEDAECIVLSANITSIEELAVADPDDLYNKVSTAEKFGLVQVPKGYSITKEKVTLWIESAKKEMPE
jgi:hypothetical protein